MSCAQETERKVAPLAVRHRTRDATHSHGLSVLCLNISFDGSMVI